MLEIVIAVVVFLLAWWLVSIIPLPSTMPRATRTALYCLLILLAIAWLVRRMGWL